MAQGGNERLLQWIEASIGLEKAGYGSDELAQVILNLRHPEERRRVQQQLDRPGPPKIQIPLSLRDKDHPFQDRKEILIERRIGQGILGLAACEDEGLLDVFQALANGGNIDFAKLPLVGVKSDSKS